MTNFRKTIFSTLLASAMVLGGTAKAETAPANKTDPQAAVNRMQQQYIERKQQRLDEFDKAKVSAEDAIKTATAKVKGDVLGVSFGTSNGHGYYRVDLFQENKPEQVNIDAKTGDVIIYKIADDRPMMAYHKGKASASKGRKNKNGRAERGKTAPEGNGQRSEPKAFKKPDVSVSLTQAIDTAVAKTGGKVVTARLIGFHKEAPGYHVVTIKDGKPFRTEIDAKSGAVKASEEMTRPKKPIAKEPQSPKPAEAPEA